MWISFLILLPSLEDVGDYLFAKSQYKEALTIYTIAHKEIPSPYLKLKMGAGLYAVGDRISSVHWLSKARSLIPEACSPFPEPANILRKIYFDNGIVELDKGNFVDALLWFEKAQAKYGIGFVNYKLDNKEKAKEVFNELGDVYALGVINYQDEHFEEAFECFKKSGQHHWPGNEREIGACLYRMNRYQDALDYFKNAGADLFTAECYYRLGEFKEAEKYYEKYLVEESPNTPLKYERDALYGLAWSHYKLEKFGEATEEFNKFVSQYPNDNLNSISMYYGGRSSLKDKKPTSAITIFKNFINDYPVSALAPNSYYWLGKAYFAKSDYNSCIQELKFLITNYSEHELCQYAYSMLGNAYREFGEYDSAITWYSQVKSPAWLLDETRFRIEECYFKIGEYESRLDILRNFVRKYPESSRAPKLAFEIGKHWEGKGNFREAVTAYDKVIQGFSWSLYANRAKLELANCYFRLRQNERALETYRELLNTDLREKALARLADVYFSLADYEQAIREYGLLINEFQESEFAMEAQERIGLSYEYLEKPVETRIAFQNFIEKYPESQDLWEVWLKLAKTYWNEGLINDYEKTLLYIKEEGGNRPRQEATYLLGVLYFDKGEYEDAKTYYLEAFSEYEESDSKSMALIGAARCAKTLGKVEEAREFYEKVIALAPNPRLEEVAKKETNELGVAPTKKE